jgi:hypothetical protein
MCKCSAGASGVVGVWAWLCSVASGKPSNKANRQNLASRGMKRMANKVG